MHKLHVLIIPGDSYKFELSQASGLKTHNIKTGFLSIEILQSYKSILRRYLKEPCILFLKLFKRIVQARRLIGEFKVSGIDGIKVIGKLVKPYNVVAEQTKLINITLAGFEEYIKAFGKPDVIHAHSRFLISALVAYNINRKYNIPYVVTEHSSSYFRDLVAESDIVSVRQVLNEAAGWIAVSNQLGNFIKYKVKGINKDFIEIPNAVDRKFELIDINDNQPSDKTIFLNVADLNKNKRHDLLIEAFELSFGGKKEFQLMIGGDGPQKYVLKRMIKEKRLAKQVHLLGALSKNEVIKQISSCKFFVVSSDFETFSLVLVEALALGKPVISTKCGGPESIINEKNGILVPKGDVFALADGMCKIKDEFRSFDPFKIRQECLTKYSTTTVTERLIELYEQVLHP